MIVSVMMFQLSLVNFAGNLSDFNGYILTEWENFCKILQNNFPFPRNLDFRFVLL